MEKHLQATRMSIFTLLDRMATKQRKCTALLYYGGILTIVLKRLGKSFAQGFIHLMSNEKDPRNLMLAFSVMKVILIEFDIVGLQEVPPKDAIRELMRNYLMPYFVTFRSPLRHGQMMCTGSRPTTSSYDYESAFLRRTTLPPTQSPNFWIR